MKLHTCGVVFFISKLVFVLVRRAVTQGKFKNNTNICPLLYLSVAGLGFSIGGGTKPSERGANAQRGNFSE